MHYLVKILQGTLIGLGAVLPGISGGVLCVVFGIYKPIMELLAEPIRCFRSHVPKLIWVFLGIIIGFLGIANLLSVLLEKYPAPSVCLFIGLIAGMMPSLFREAGQQGRSRKSYIAMYTAMAVVFSLLVALEILSVNITPGFGWYVFCGFCLALSVIAPGMSFSTLLMPLELYEPFVAGIGGLDGDILIPAGMGALATVILFSKMVNLLFEKHYSVAFHAIIGVVIAATVMIVPFTSFAASPGSAILNMICLAAGMAAALLLDRFQRRYDK